MEKKLIEELKRKIYQVLSQQKREILILEKKEQLTNFLSVKKYSQSRHYFSCKFALN